MCTHTLRERYVNFYTDFAFKKLFGTEINKDLLISFLNALLQGHEEITDLTYLNTEQLGTAETERKAVFDVYCETVTGERILIEMQKAEQRFFKDRSIFYSTFPIRDQAQKGDWDYRLSRVYTIGVLNFTFDDDDPAYFHHEVKLMDTRNHKVFYDKLTYIYLEMPKFVKTEAELVTLFDKWLYAIRNMATLMERPEALQEAVFTRLFEQAEIAKFNPQERMNYEESLKDYRDMYSVMKTQLEKGLAQGREEGLAQGREEGREEGIAIGKLQATLASARAFIEQGIPRDVVQKTLGLTDEQLKEL
ncbi:MAG: Rpn family recombination-promoting nuclease/putative transposase [Bacteroidaceae bacterium]|nr:Rpn family recombination-promoting nuclease/putative transposase [Bacteroidaceae bacterium]